MNKKKNKKTNKNKSKKKEQNMKKYVNGSHSFKVMKK